MNVRVNLLRLYYTFGKKTSGGIFIIEKCLTRSPEGVGGGVEGKALFEEARGVKLKWEGFFM